MITTSDTYVVEEGSRAKYAGASIFCILTYHDADEITTVLMRMVDNSSIVDAGILGTVTVQFTNTELTAFTASGANDILKYYNLVEQAVVDYLEGLTANSGLTFTIA